MTNGQTPTTTYPTDPLARSDFSGNGTVDFPDFLAFANAFGKNSTDSDFNARIDLNDDGSVNFPDFLVFARLFGQKVVGQTATKPLGQYPGINTPR
jgi:Ca2+-binding EF-hand superfamily protein